MSSMVTLDIPAFATGGERVECLPTIWPGIWAVWVDDKFMTYVEEEGNAVTGFHTDEVYDYARALEKLNREDSMRSTPLVTSRSCAYAAGCVITEREGLSDHHSLLDEPLEDELRSTERGMLCGHCGEPVADETLCPCVMRPLARAESAVFMTNWDALVDTMRKIRLAKQNDYTGGEGPLANYDATAEFLGSTTELVMLGRMHEKMVRVKNLLGDTDQMVMDEKIEDTILDIANIALLIGASLLTKEQMDAA